MKKISVFLISLVFLLTLVACGKKDDNLSSETPVPAFGEFVKPTDYAAFLSMKINPHFGLYLDESQHVLAIETLNTDAETVKQSIQTTDTDLKAVIQNIVIASKNTGFLKPDAVIHFEITEVNSEPSLTSDVLKNAAAAVESTAAELEMSVTAQTAVKTASDKGTQTSSQTTNNTAQTTSGPTNTPAHTHTFSKAATCTEPATCACGATNGEPLGHSWQVATCQAPKTCKVCKMTEGEKANHTFVNGKCTVCGMTNVLNPKTNLEIDKEYVANIYFPETDNSIYAPGIAFYNDGGYGNGEIYCVLLTASFTSDKNSVDPGRKPITHDNTEYYRCGAGQSPAYVTLTDTEIIVTNETDTIKMILTGDGNLKVTSSNDKDFPVDTVLSISWNGLS